MSEKTLHCKLLSVELLKDTEVQSVCVQKSASDLLATFFLLSITYIRTVAPGLVIQETSVTERAASADPQVIAYSAEIHTGLQSNTDVRQRQRQLMC